MAHSTASNSSCWGGLCSIAGVCLGIVPAGVCVWDAFSCPTRDVPKVEAWRHGADRCGSTWNLRAKNGFSGLAAWAEWRLVRYPLCDDISIESWLDWLGTLSSENFFQLQRFFWTWPFLVPLSRICRQKGLRETCAWNLRLGRTRCVSVTSPQQCSHVLLPKGSFGVFSNRLCAGASHQIVWGSSFFQWLYPPRLFFETGVLQTLLRTD